MNDAPTGKTSIPESGTDWERLRNISDAELRAAIDADPDAPGRGHGRFFPELYAKAKNVRICLAFSYLCLKCYT